MIIYYCFHIESGRGYIGQTIRTLEGAKRRHLRSKSYIGNALRLYGIENFKWVELDQSKSIEELNNKEIYWIDRLDTLHPLGFNILIGGSSRSGFKLLIPRSLEYCRKMSDTLKGVNYNDGRIEKMVNSKRKLSPENVLTIRTSSKSIEELSSEFNVSTQAIWKVKTFRSFRNELGGS